MHKIALIIALFFSHLLFAQSKNQSDRRFVFSSGYFASYFNSNEGLVYFPLSIMQSYSKLFDKATTNFSHRTGTKLAIAALELPVSYWLSNSLFIPFHEFGHARYSQALGKSVKYGSFSYGIHFEELDSFWSLSMLRFLTPPHGFPGGGIAYASGILPSNASVDQELILTASGLNNQTFLAKKIGNLVYEHDGHFTYLQQYIGNKISGFVYTLLYSDTNTTSDSDIAKILSSYKNKNYNITHTDLELQSLLSLVSGTTFALMRGYYNYFSNNSTVVKPAEIYGLRVPDINSYINSNGLSLELESDFRFSPFLSIGLAYEFIWKGEFDQQLTPRVRYNLAQIAPQLNEMWIDANIVLGKGVGGSIKADYSPWTIKEHDFLTRLGFFADMTVYNANNLYGERNIVSLKNNNTIATELILGTYIRY